MPSATASAEDPPYEISGSVIPLVGINCNEDAEGVITFTLKKPV